MAQKPSEILRQTAQAVHSGVGFNSISRVFQQNHSQTANTETDGLQHLVQGFQARGALGKLSAQLLGVGLQGFVVFLQAL